MNSKRFIRFSLCLTLILLILVASMQIAIDPLFQYHKPWFGLKYVVADERYINAGVAKNGSFENAVIGNSMSENFMPSDVTATFEGESVSLVMHGSYALDWSYVLNILSNRKRKINNILINIDPYVFEASPTHFEHELPRYLYDDNIVNDVKYFSIFQSLIIILFVCYRKTEIILFRIQTRILCGMTEMSVVKRMHYPHIKDRMSVLIIRT